MSLSLTTLLLCWNGAGPLLGAEISTPAAPAWDTYSDTWVATDALGRPLPGYAEAGPPRADRYVGIFYFLWLGSHAQGGLYDVSKLKAQNPAHPAWGPMYAPHHWGSRSSGITR